jgi:uncharacterized coiled-coil DUF342 family protein
MWGRKRGVVITGIFQEEAPEPDPWAEHLEKTIDWYSKQHLEAVAEIKVLKDKLANAEDDILVLRKLLTAAESQYAQLKQQTVQIIWTSEAQHVVQL